jgi:hypothetical protein
MAVWKSSDITTNPLLEKLEDIVLLRVAFETVHAE